jgi:hypothetical protein
MYELLHVNWQGRQSIPQIFFLGGTDSKLGRSEGMLLEIIFKFWYTETAFQRYGGTYKVILQCAWS